MADLLLIDDISKHKVVTKILRVFLRFGAAVVRDWSDRRAGVRRLWSRDFFLLSIKHL
jgi:hypothetical protein